MRVLTASFKKILLTCDFTVSSEISRVRAMRLLAKPWLMIVRTSRSRAVSVTFLDEQLAKHDGRSVEAVSPESMAAGSRHLAQGFAKSLQPGSAAACGGGRPV
jgi:hypothetical protein